MNLRKGMIELLDLIGFSGKMTSGKTTLAERLVHQYGHKRMAIGNEIKRVSNYVIEDIKNIQPFLEGRKNAEVMYEAFLTLKEELKEATFVKNGDVYEKNEYYRYLTQQTGDILRNNLGSDIWVRIFLEEVKKQIENGHKVVCDDVRMLSEYQLLQENGFTLVRLEVDEDVQIERIKRLYNTFSPEALTHRTETELDNAGFECVIDTTTDTIEQSGGILNDFLITKSAT